MLFSHAINFVFFFLLFHCQQKEEGTDIRHSFAIETVVIETQVELQRVCLALI